MPVSSLGYVLDPLIELEFIVIDTRIDARNSAAKLENPASITKPRPAAPGACAASTRLDNDIRNLLITKRLPAGRQGLPNLNLKTIFQPS